MTPLTRCPWCGSDPLYVEYHYKEWGVPASTDISNALSKYLKKHGFNFVGSTIVYAFMQAVVMVDDHLISCHKH